MMNDEKSISLKKKILFSAVLLVGFIALLELTGSIYYRFGFTGEKRELLETIIGSDRSHAPAPRYVPHPYFNYTCNPAYRDPDGEQPYNSRGFRQPGWTAKKKGTLRIVALGGSTTYGMHSKNGSDVWPALLEKKLQAQWGPGIEVLNLGIPGFTTHELIGVAAMLVPILTPDIVLIHAGANDAFSACYPDEGGPDNTGFRFSFSYKPIPGALLFLMRNSKLIRVLAFRYAVSSKGYLPGDMIAAMQYRHPSDEDAVKNGAKATGKYFRQNIDSLIALVRNTGAIPVLLTHPLNPQWEYPTKVFYQAMVEAHRRNNRIVMEMAQLRDVPVVDLYIPMREVRYFIDAIHESPAGMETKALLIVPAINALIERLNHSK
ncbi:MAG: SGNH/GDSL hydrolase family protein [Candidatus Aminicenantes bacterium]|nr:SGNH/GDSL hydrolase family protein [Candidatus Aminicenantes bacterium]